MLGTGFVTASGKAAELPPFGGGLVTTISTVPDWATSAELMPTCSVVELTKIVERLLLFTETADWVKKFWPVMVRVNPPLPVVTPEGERPVICGAGLGAGLMVNVSGVLGSPPPGEGVVTL